MTNDESSVYDSVVAATAENTATKLRASGPDAQLVWGLIGTVSMRHRPSSRPDRWEVTVEFLIARAVRVWGWTPERVRAALTVLAAFHLVEFGDFGVDRHGIWSGPVTELLGGEQGGAAWPWWGDHAA